MKQSVLIVDECPTRRMQLQQRFTSACFDAITAGDAMAALRTARRFRPQLIVMDLILPDLDGIAVCDLLRAQLSTTATPILLLCDPASCAALTAAGGWSSTHLMNRESSDEKIVSRALQILENHIQLVAAILVQHSGEGRVTLMSPR